MSRILVLGGYGGFGGRVARRLAEAGHEVLVAGRSQPRAEAFCQGRPGLVPVAVERRDVAAALARHRPALLVDASGPFQAMDHAVPRACVAAGVHYVDLADASGFVAGIGALDAEARAAGVVVRAGASSVPALSGAVAQELARGMRRVTAVEIAISASNQASAGPSVAAAILGQLGQAFRLWRGQAWETAYGWCEVRRLTFAVPGLPPLGPRMVGLVDVPDVALLPGRLPGRPAVVFHAGTELPVQNLALWLGGWLVRRGWLRSLAPAWRWAEPLQRPMRRFGTDRSAMLVRLAGEADGARLERRWTLIAERGDGPEIPSLAVPPLVARILAGQEAPGARDAGESLALEDYEPAFRALAVTCHVQERELPPSLYVRVLGGRFAGLPPAVRRMHDVLADGGARGEAEVLGAANPLARLIARTMGFPPAGRVPLHVRFAEHGEEEVWTRDFGGRRFRSVMARRGPWLVERFGPFRFAFELAADQAGIGMRMRRWWLGPLRLPLRLAPRSEAREWEEAGRFRFDVPIALPLVGRLVHYRGWLAPDDGAG